MANNEEFDGPDLEADLEQGENFGDFEDAPKSMSFSEVMKKNPLIKFGLVGAGVVAVIALVSIFGGKDEVAPNSSVSATQKDFKSTPGTEELTPEMKAAMEDSNAQRIEAAERSGDSAIVTPIEPPKNLLEVPADPGATEDPLLRWKQMQEERVRIQREQQQQEAALQEDPATEDQLKIMTEAMSAQLSSILGKVPLPSTQHIMVIDPANLRKKEVQNAGGQETMVDGQQQADGTAANLPPPKIIIPAGKIDYGQIMIEANSDIPGPVLALLVSGPFTGGKLIGTFNKTNEYLVIKFTTLVTKKGTSIPIDAYAVNPDTSLTAMATDVDHRYFTRIIIPAASKFVEGLGAAISQTTTTTSQSSTSTTTSTPKPDLKQELGKAFEEAASQVSSVLQEEGDATEILVRVRAGTPVGVMFMQPVTDQQIKQAQSGISMDPNAQQGQQNGQGNMGNPYGGFPNQNQLSPLQQLQQSFLSQQGLMAGQQGQNGLFGQTGNGSNTSGASGTSSTGQTQQ